MQSLQFRTLQNENDYPILLEINRSSRKADGNSDEIKLSDIADTCSQMGDPSQREGVIITLDGEVPAGYSRLGWYSSRPDNRLYWQVSFFGAEISGKRPLAADGGLQ